MGFCWRSSTAASARAKGSFSAPGARRPEGTLCPGERQGKGFLLGGEHPARPVAQDGGNVVAAGDSEAWGKKDVGLQRRVAIEAIGDDQNVAVRVRRHLQGETEALMRVNDLDRGR